jgi:non-structural maintenance of chromosomes element 1
MHRHCLVKFRRQKNSCPSCNNAWPQDDKDKQLLPVGEDAAREGQDGKRQTRMRSTEQSEDEDVESAEDPEPSQNLTPQNNARKGKKNPVRSNNSMEVDPAENVEASQPQKTRRSSRR